MINTIKEDLMKKLAQDGGFWPYLIIQKTEAGKRAKRFMGPLFSNDEQQALADESLVKILFSYVEADLRACLYSELNAREFPASDAIFSPRPLRQNSPDGKLIAPALVVDNGRARSNPEWENAEYQWGFKISPGVIFGELNLVLSLSAQDRCWFRRGEISRNWGVNLKRGNKFLFRREELENKNQKQKEQP